MGGLCELAKRTSLQPETASSLLIWSPNVDECGWKGGFPNRAYFLIEGVSSWTDFWGNLLLELKSSIVFSAPLLLPLCKAGYLHWYNLSLQLLHLEDWN